MALNTLKPTSRTVSILINAVNYNTVADRIGFRSTSPVMRETVFSTENAGGEKSVGTEEQTITLSGIMKRGATEARPFLSIATYQSLSYTIQFDVSNTLAGTLNMFDTDLNMPAGETGRWTSQAVGTGSYTVSWNTSS